MFKSLLEQGLAAWNDSTGAARAGLIILALILVGGIVGVGIWSSQPSYVAIRVDVPSGKLDQAMVALQKQAIRFKVNGSQILVDERQKAEASTLLDKSGIPKSGNEPEFKTPNLFDPSIQHHSILKFNMEKQLEAMIGRIEGVNSAQVLLNLPKKSRFLSRTAPASASIALDVDHSYFDKQQAQTIGSIVSDGVPGLPLKNITISDNQGIKYEIDSSNLGLSNQEEFQRNREMRYTFQIRQMLGGSLGHENVLATVNLQTSYENAQVNSTTWDAANQIKRKQRLKTETKNSVQRSGRGPSGTQSNVGRGAGASGGGGINDTMEEIENETDVPETSRQETINKFSVDQMSISVVINQSKVEERAKELGKDAATLKTELEEVVKTAVLFNEKRGDKLNISFLPLEDLTPPEPVAAPIPWEQIHEVMRNISLGFAGIVAVLLCVMTFRKMTPSDNAPLSAALSNRKAQMERITEMVEQHPEVLSQVIAAWAKSDGVPRDDEKREAA